MTSPLPPGLGVMPSVFDVNKIYHDFDVTYTDIDGSDFLTQVLYYDVNAATIATVDITYTANLEPIYKGHEMKGHSFNIFTAAFELIQPTTTPSPPILDIDLDNQTIFEGSAIGTLLGTLSITGGTPPESYQIMSQDVDTLFDLSGNTLVVNEELLGNASPTYNITIRAVDAAAEEYSKVFEIDITAYTSDYSTIFDGISEYGTIPTNAAWQTADRTVALWYKTTGSASAKTLVSKNRSGGGGVRHEWSIQMLAGGKIAMSIYEDSSNYKSYQLSSLLNLDDGNWHHIAWTYEQTGDTFVVYHNGAVATHIPARNDAMTGIQASATDLLVAAGFNSIGSIITLFDGNIDELVFGDAALNTSEILDIYNLGVPQSLLQQTYSTDIVSWWRMGELDTSPTITDVNAVDSITMVNMDQSNFVLDTP
jgi:hypothetical protein